MLILLKIALVLVLVSLIWQIFELVGVVAEGIIEFTHARRKRIADKIANEVNKRYSLETKMKKK